MTAQQSPQPNSHPPRTASASRPVGRGLLWSAGAFLLGSLLVYNSVDTSADPKPQSPSAVASSATPRSSASPAFPDLSLPRSAPKRVRIPEIAVDAPFTQLSIGSTGQLDAPPAADKNLVGWFKDGAAPGERGSAIIAGHVDTKTGPAVFLQLESLKPGSTINITREDGVIATLQGRLRRDLQQGEVPQRPGLRRCFHRAAPCDHLRWGIRQEGQGLRRQHCGVRPPRLVQTGLIPATRLSRPARLSHRTHLTRLTRPAP